MRNALRSAGVLDSQMHWISGVMGVPITFLDQYNPNQFEIVVFRKGEDGKDLVFTREREREFNRTSGFLYDVDTGYDKKQGRDDRKQDYICSHYHYEKEPIDVAFPLATNLSNGLINDCCVNGKKTYVRLLVRKKVRSVIHEDYTTH